MSLRRRINSFRFAFRGLADLFRNQANARIHLVVAVVVALAGWWLGLSRLEWVAVVLSIALVISMEAMNTALEYLADRISPAHDPLVGKAKDAAAAAVLIAAFGAVTVGLIIFLPKLYVLVFG